MNLFALAAQRQALAGSTSELTIERSRTVIRKIAIAAVYVEDQRSAVEFWTKQVGFTLHREKAMDLQASWIEMGPPHAESCLVIYPKSMMEDWAERKPSIVFECDNIQKTYDTMRNHGVQFTQPPKQCLGDRCDLPA